MEDRQHLVKLRKIDALLEEIQNLKKTITKKRNQARSKYDNITACAENVGGITLPLAKIKLSSARFLKGHIGKVHDIRWTGDDAHLVSVAQDNCVIIWDVRNGYINNVIEVNAIQPLTLDVGPNSETIFCGGLSASAAVYRKREPQASDTYSQYEVQVHFDHESRLSCCKYVGDNKFLTAADAEGCTLWDIESSTKLNRFQGHISGVLAMALLHGKNTFLTGSCDATVKLWDMRIKNKKNCMQTFEGHESDVTSLSVFPGSSNSCFVSGSDDTWTCLFDIRSDNLIARYSDPLWRELDPNRDGYDNAEIHRPDPPSVCSVSLSNSGRLLFAGCKDGIMYCYDIFNPNNHVDIYEEPGPVSKLALSNGGNGLASAVWDSKNRIRIWTP